MHKVRFLLGRWKKVATDLRESILDIKMSKDPWQLIHCIQNIGKRLKNITNKKYLIINNHI